MHFSKMQLVSHCYTAVLFEPISKLFIYKNSIIYLSDCRVTFFFVFFFFFFLHDTKIEKPDYSCVKVQEVIGFLK